MKKTHALFALAALGLLASCAGRPSSTEESDSLSKEESSIVEEPSLSYVASEKLVYDMSGVTFSGKSFGYDGLPKSLAIEGTLPNGVSVSYEGNDKINAGEYEVIAHFTGDSAYEPIDDMKATLTILKSSYDLSGVSFSGEAFTYDGTEKSIFIKGDLPEGVSVSYEGNNKINAGEYEVVASFSGDDVNYEPIAKMKATLTINKAVFDSSSLTFHPESFVYDGSPKSIEVMGDIPEGITVEYTGNGEVNVGTYAVTASFVDTAGNYEPIASLVSSYTIGTATFVPQFEDATFHYDGSAKSLVLSNSVPDGITVTYTGNEQTLPGVYEVTASFETSGNYAPIESITRTMTIDYPTYVYTDQAYAEKGVSLERLEDGTIIYSNGTSGIVSGENQNWGESGIFFWETIHNYSLFTSSGSRYVKFDVYFEESVQSFNLRFGSGVTEFYVTEVGFDTPFPWGRQLNFFDMNGQRVDRLSHNVWYTMYIEVVGAYMNSFWTNGGSSSAPAVAKVRNAECVKDINPSCAPYVKSGGGTVSIATEEGREGSFKVENGGNAVNFFGVTHTNS
ncbi:MAG: MBG domain-containing protein, partial [Candidatus Enteromonas sp.]|nr:MBG domain-containing protein [Candidatus Enteromonas sp.]